MEPGMTYSKAQTPGTANENMIQYFNFLLVEKNIKGTRKAFSLMDVLGALGGANRSFGVIIAFMLIPFKYNITATQMYSGLLVNYFNNRKTSKSHKHNEPKYKFMNKLKDISVWDGTFNFYWYFHDKFKACKLQGFFKGCTSWCCCFDWDRFDKKTALMKELKTMETELINLIDHDATKVFQHKIPVVMKDDDMKISEDETLEDMYHGENDDDSPTLTKTQKENSCEQNESDLSKNSFSMDVRFFDGHKPFGSKRPSFYK